MSQLSQSSTVPPDLLESQDEYFIEELNNVDELYFNTEHIENQEPLHESDSGDESPVNFESDSDSDQENFNEHIAIEPSVVDLTESRCIEHFKNQTCGCKKLYKLPCSQVIDFDEVLTQRENCRELSTAEIDMIIKGQLSAHRQTGIKTSAKKHKSKNREKPSQKYFFEGQQICRETFCFIHCIGRKKLQSIAQSLDSDGLLPRVHGLTKSLPKHGMTYIDVDRIKTFICKYAKDNALPLPGRLPNFKQSHVLVLPSDKSLADVHQLYEKTAKSMNFRSVSLRTFQRTWHEFCPHVTISRPSTDICQKCQNYATKLANSGNMNEDEKKELLSQYSGHVEKAKKQRDHYRDSCELSKRTLEELPQELKQGNPPCVLDSKIHYSWDYAQQVHYPHHSQQVGPIYFKTPRKCNVFGICSEGSGKQVFYLVDEAEGVGKGANSVVSMAHHYFQHHGMGEKEASIHFDNCSGQNKNNVVLQYAMWRVMNGLHDKIELSTMIAGHTKFHPDWHFGIWKCRWRNSNAETMTDIAKTVTDSSRNGHNLPQLVSDPAKPVMFYDWKKMLQEYFKPLKNLTQYHHFTMSATNAGVVECKLVVDSPPIVVNILKKNRVVTPELPDVIVHPELDINRQWYLYDQIREFCTSVESMDICCPKPLVPKTEIDVSEEIHGKVIVGQKRKQSLLN